MGSRSRNGRGRTLAAESAAQAPPPGAPIAVSQISIAENERAELKALDDQAIKLKCQVADLTFELRAKEQQRDQLLVALQQVSKNYDERVGVFARAHGIDVDDPGKGHWTFDGKEGTFMRTDLPGVVVAPTGAAPAAPGADKLPA